MQTFSNNKKSIFLPRRRTLCLLFILFFSTFTIAVTLYDDNDDRNNTTILDNLMIDKSSSISSSNTKSPFCPTIGNNENSNNMISDDPNGKYGFWETSGIALSYTQMGPSGEPILFVINDKGAGSYYNRLGIFDSGTGERLLTLRLSLLFQPGHDYESMTIGTCGIRTITNSNNNNKYQNKSSSTSSSFGSCLYLGDIGDNRARTSIGQRTDRRTRTVNNRSSQPYRIYKLEEPIWTEYSDNENLVPSNHYYDILEYNYKHETSPTQYADSETLFIDHLSTNGDLYIITKWDKQYTSLTRLFHIPASAWGNNKGSVYSPRAYNAGEDSLLSSKIWTRGEMSSDGMLIALGDEIRLYLFLRCYGSTVQESLFDIRKDNNENDENDEVVCASWRNFQSNVARKHETIAFVKDKTRTLQISECTTSDKICNPPMVWTQLEYNFPEEEDNIFAMIDEDNTRKVDLSNNNHKNNNKRYNRFCRQQHNDDDDDDTISTGGDGYAELLPSPPSSSFEKYGCFPGNSIVRVQDKRSSIAIQDLKLGDRILTDEKNTYETVYSFGHYQPHRLGTYLRFTLSRRTIKNDNNNTIATTTTNTTFTISPNHLVFVQNRGIIPSSQIKIMDTLLWINIPEEDEQEGDYSAAATTRTVVVIKIESSVFEMGMYAPLTPSGKIRVNNIMTSCYVSLSSSQQQKYQKNNHKNGSNQDCNNTNKCDSSFFDTNWKLFHGYLQLHYHWLSYAYEIPHRWICKYQYHYYTKKQQQQQQQLYDTYDDNHNNNKNDNYYCIYESYEDESGLSEWASQSLSWYYKLEEKVELFGSDEYYYQRKDIIAIPLLLCFLFFFITEQLLIIILPTMTKIIMTFYHATRQYYFPTLSSLLYICSCIIYGYALLKLIIIIGIFIFIVIVTAQMFYGVYLDICSS